MNYNFDSNIDRSNTNALAEEGYLNYLFAGKKITPKANLKKEKLISMWVADMQFATAPVAIEAMTKRLEHPIFGYTMNFDDELYNAFHSWCKNKYEWSFKQEEMQVALGVIPTLYDVIDHTCKVDEKILTLTPAYGFFKHATDYHKRELVTSKLIKKNNAYFIDFEDFENKVKDSKVKLFFFCHPHNPTGRVWSEDELKKIGKICFENDVIVISDEIHCDLLRKKEKHIPLAKLFPEEKNIITCMAPSKTFNLAGMMIATIIIPDPKLRKIWKERTLPFTNPISLAAAIGVFKNGNEWLEDLRSYLDENFSLLDNFLKEYLPHASFKIPDATYLAWIDLEYYFDKSVNLTKFFVENAGVILEGGEMFIENGGICIRLNLACPKAQVQLALERIYHAIKNNNRIDI